LGEAFDLSPGEKRSLSSSTTLVSTELDGSGLLDEHNGGTEAALDVEVLLAKKFEIDCCFLAGTLDWDERGVRTMICKTAENGSMTLVQRDYRRHSNMLGS
jgi:hypothetical protein